MECGSPASTRDEKRGSIARVKVAMDGNIQSRACPLRPLKKCLVLKKTLALIEGHRNIGNPVARSGMFSGGLKIGRRAKSVCLISDNNIVLLPGGGK